MFTDRDFDGGVLGLAWVASLSSSGGVCETFKTYSGNEQKSLNTGIVTVKNYGKSVASVVTQVTFAHELGHNFGSDHDKDGTSCAPGGDQGNFIMYSKATSGYLSNNDEFSTCSVQQISPIIANKARSSSGCFTVHTGKICGNKIVEGDEECDCGWDDECSESCCVPQSSGASNPCTFNNPSNTPNFCSPSQGPCCTSNCQYRQSSESYTCRQNTTCMDKAVTHGLLSLTFSNGSGFSCPDSSPKSNGTSCNDGQVCYLGECSASVCLANGYQSCQCPGNGFSDANLCKLCCVDGNGSCKFASELSGITETNAFPGSLCNDFQGYCDVFYVCREVDPSGPLNNIRKLLLSGEVIETVKTFLTEHWYVGIAAGVGLIIILAVIVKVCSKSHGPKARSSSLEVLSKNNRVGPRETHM
ncbi:hypothetical protein FSP39_022532 [Pinctada imbricata]|uniref:ADAM10 endopeptidase n=1 Tax=Pinctada imbricata TaxID=66713 RepID=A0AA88YAG2_PINIB|nr:hypothetical protein FSP39_022532 [Pinctada imbricata]